MHSVSRSCMTISATMGDKGEPIGVTTISFFVNCVVECEIRGGEHKFNSHQKIVLGNICKLFYVLLIPFNARSRGTLVNKAVTSRDNNMSVSLTVLPDNAL